MALRELILTRFDSLDRETHLRATTVEQARIDMNRRLDGMNEFRQQLAATESTYLKRSEWDVSHTALEERLQQSGAATEMRLRSIERLVYIGVGAVLVINIAASYFLKH